MAHYHGSGICVDDVLMVSEAVHDIRIRHQQNERTPELIRVTFDDLKHLPWRDDVASDGVVLQVFRDEVRIHREAPASGARFSPSPKTP